MAATAGLFTATRTELTAADITGEFMLNALRLNDGFSLAQFSAHTGQEAAVLEHRLQDFQQRGLLIVDGQRVSASELGRRFLDSVIAGFFPD